MEHDVDPRTSLTAEQIAERYVTEIKRLSKNSTCSCPDHAQKFLTGRRSLHGGKFNREAEDPRRKLVA